MKTDITYQHKGRLHHETLDCRNPSNAPAVLFLKHKHLDPLKVKIINCIGRVTFSTPYDHFQSRANAQNKS